jgi:ACT domain-containing protein
MNIIKINQNPPADSVAAASISVRQDNDLPCDKKTLVACLEKIDGVLDVKITAGAV